MTESEPETSADKIDAALKAQQDDEREESRTHFDRLAESTERIADALASDRPNEAGTEAT